MFRPGHVDLHIRDSRDLAVFDHDELVFEQHAALDIDNIHVVEHEGAVEVVREIARDALDHRGVLLDLDRAQLRKHVGAPAPREHTHVAAEVEDRELQIIIEPGVRRCEAEARNRIQRQGLGSIGRLDIR